MRPIKFRAWHKYQKQMTTGLYLDFNGQIGMWNHEETEIEFGEYSELILMQYTGLKDRNGKEIFEGDIVCMNPHDDNWMAVVEWWPKRGRFELDTFIKNPNAVTNCELYDWVKGADNPSENPMIVVGNIYESPEKIEEGVCPEDLT